jgi:hypothetical protein
MLTEESEKALVLRDACRKAIRHERIHVRSAHA